MRRERSDLASGRAPFAQRHRYLIQHPGKIAPGSPMQRQHADDESSVVGTDLRCPVIERAGEATSEVDAVDDPSERGRERGLTLSRSEGDRLWNRQPCTHPRGEGSNRVGQLFIEGGLEPGVSASAADDRSDPHADEHR